MNCEKKFQFCQKKVYALGMRLNFIDLFAEEAYIKTEEVRIHEIQMPAKVFHAKQFSYFWKQAVNSSQFGSWITVFFQQIQNIIQSDCINLIMIFVFFQALIYTSRILTVYSHLFLCQLFPPHIPCSFDSISMPLFFCR